MKNLIGAVSMFWFLGMNDVRNSHYEIVDEENIPGLIWDPEKELRKGEKTKIPIDFLKERRDSYEDRKNGNEIRWDRIRGIRNPGRGFRMKYL